MRLIKSMFIMILGLSSVSAFAHRVIGSVDTNFKWIGRDDHIEISTFNDDKLTNVVCYISYAKTGGVKGAIGVAVDSSDGSIQCITNGAVDKKVFDNLPKKEQVWKKRSDLFFKTMQVVRFKDPQNNAVIYLTYSDKLIDGSPKNSITVVPLTFQ